jgi:hypothetical protein
MGSHVRRGEYPSTCRKRHCCTDTACGTSVCGHSGRGLRARAAMRPTRPRRSEFGSTYQRAYRTGAYRTGAYLVCAATGRVRC